MAQGDEQWKKVFFTYKCPLYHIVSKKKMPEFGPARGKSLTYPGQKNNITFQKNPYQSLRNLKYECNIFTTVYTVSTIHIGYVLLG